MFDAHPAFQIDRNFGGSAGIIEMLVQSRPGEVRLLPALPAQWPDGSLRGVRARGGLEVDLTWCEGRPEDVVVRSSRAQAATLIWRDHRKPIRVEAGQELRLDLR